MFLGGQPRVGSQRRQNIGAAYLSAHGITDNNQILHDDPAIDEKKIFTASPSLRPWSTFFVTVSDARSVSDS